MADKQAVAATGIMLLILAGCSQQPDAATPRPTGSSSLPTLDPTPASTLAGPKDQALAAYRGMWAAFTEASQTSDYDAPELQTYAAGDALRLIQSGMRRSHDDNVVSKGRPTLMDEKFTTVGESRVGIDGCVDDSGWPRYSEAGDKLEGSQGGRRRTTATVTKEGDAWKVTKLRIWEPATC